jgi:hypothetical protein
MMNFSIRERILLFGAILLVLGGHFARKHRLAKHHTETLQTSMTKDGETQF